ncbi:T9SS type A sorting domain-containing protein [Bacteroidota bacterium]
MKSPSLLFIAFLLLQITTLAQQNVSEKTRDPVFFKVTSHDSNITELPEKSFYESRTDWQYIIDTTWGPGLPLAEKQQIFNAYATSIRDEFDGFESLQMNTNSWDTLRYNYYSMINDSTSKGGFSAIMSHFSMQLKDVHTYAFNESVVLTPLNPGIPVLVISAFLTSIDHFGAVVTALPDSSLLVLRTVANHPLDLQPGDILLGYEGIPWKILVNELLDAGLPTFGRWGGAQSAHSDALLLGAGMNWHLFETIDILKHSTSDTVHLSVNPLLNLPPVNMLNNEQLSVPGVLFPNFYNQQYVSYGIIDGTNIGYIYLYQEVQGISDQQFYEAVTALLETDALIIDMRLNFGGWAFFNNSLEILFNESHLTIEDASRCNINDFTLCPFGNSSTFNVPGNPPAFYDRPIAIFLGPTCVSMGDVTAQRFRYHPTVRFFAKSSAASLGNNVPIVNFPGWDIRYSISDMFHVNEPGEYLNRTEFPIDYPVWFNPEDVANGYDTVVEEALEWMNNLVYGHDVMTDKGYASPGVDSITVSATVENPNSHNVIAKVFVQDLDNTLIDSLELFETESGELWQGEWLASNYEDIFKLEIKAIDQTTGESFTIENVNRITTAGPIVIDSLEISYLPSSDLYQLKPHIKNEGQTQPLEYLFISMSSDDSTITSISGPLYIGSLTPGETIIHPGNYSVRVDSNFSGEFRFNFETIIDGWPYWHDSYPDSIINDVQNEITLPVSYALHQNYPNPFNPTTTIQYDIKERSLVELVLYDVLGREVEVLVNREQDAGYYEIEFNASRLASGIYFYRLQVYAPGRAGNFVETKKMVLMK